ncbi:MGMT family protein [Desulfospira joergensenii]|uniref:MGMT family protein n=1 Tax=Desulfospira joergensenii TaxID=53329 RepID=UPI0003B4DF08|nr:MGMT family protein [Desulfospira joergensenii]
MLDIFTQRALKVIKAIPEGRVLTYGRTAGLAGKPGGARQVSRLLHSMSRKHDLPWHRVINSQGRISLKPSHGYELQKALLEDEGVEFSLSGRVDLSVYLWEPGPFWDIDVIGESGSS